MENIEDTEAFFDKQGKELAETIRRHGNFVKELEEELIILPFTFLPQIGKYRDRFINTLIKEAHIYAININERLEYHLCPLSNYTDENLCNFNVPKREEQTSIDAEIAEVIIAAKGDREYIEEMTGSILANHKKAEFTFLCHDKVKEMINKHFPEIADLSGNAIRDINCVAYANMCEYRTAFYYLTINYR